jgi:hypothetical protein
MAAAKNKCTSVVGHFDGHASALEQYRWHHPMRCHWMLPSGDYSVRIASMTAEVTANKTTIEKCTNFAGNFDGCGGAPVQYRTHRLMEKVRAMLDATGCHNWAIIAADSSIWTYQLWFLF